MGPNSVCRQKTVATLPTAPAVLTIDVCLTGLLIPALLLVPPVAKVLLAGPNKNFVFLARWYLEVLRLSFKRSLQNYVKSIDVVSTTSNSTSLIGEIR